MSRFFAAGYNASLALGSLRQTVLTYKRLQSPTIHSAICYSDPIPNFSTRLRNVARVVPSSFAA
jgi:hypothetical protein